MFSNPGMDLSMNGESLGYLLVNAGGVCVMLAQT